MVILPSSILWSCCKHDDDNSYQEEPIQISCDVATKALIGSLPDLAAQGYSDVNGIGIYGFKQNADNSFTRLFDNMRLYQTVDTAGATESTIWNWTYTPTRYWDSNPNVSYQFMAYWPRLSNTQQPDKTYVSVSDPNTENGVKVAKEHMIIHNFPNWQLIDGSSEMDLITATKVGRYAENFKPLGGKVYLSFYHALSQLVIKAYYVGTDKKSEGGVSINGIKIYKSENGEGYLYDGEEGSKGTDFLLEYNNTRAAKPDTVSAGRGIDIFTAEPDTGFALPWQPADTIKYRDELNDRPDFEPSYVNSWLMIPHRWHDLGLEVNYRAGNTAAKTSSKIPVTLGAETDDYYTLAGKTYVLTLIIDTSDGGVKVESLAVRQWLTHNISKEFYNW